MPGTFLVLGFLFCLIIPFIQDAIQQRRDRREGERIMRLIEQGANRGNTAASPRASRPKRILR